MNKFYKPYIFSFHYSLLRVIALQLRAILTVPYSVEYSMDLIYRIGFPLSEFVTSSVRSC
jgi:hypothetical protein